MWCCSTWGPVWRQVWSVPRDVSFHLGACFLSSSIKVPGRISAGPWSPSEGLLAARWPLNELLSSPPCPVFFVVVVLFSWQIGGHEEVTARAVNAPQRCFVFKHFKATLFGFSDFSFPSKRKLTLFSETSPAFLLLVFFSLFCFELSWIYFYALLLPLDYARWHSTGTCCGNQGSACKIV